MYRFEFQYNLAPGSVPFAATPGRAARFTPQLSRSCHPTVLAENRGQISWKLKNHLTNTVFSARQLINRTSGGRISKLLSEESLIPGRYYETLAVSSQAKMTQPGSDRPIPTQADGLGFAENTLIMTSRGEVPVQSVSARDKILTRDHGLQLVRWVGKTTRHIQPGNEPIVFAKATINNSQDLTLCPNQRVVLRGVDALMVAGDPEALVHAHRFVDGHRVRLSELETISYYRILTNQHDLIYANAAAVESYLPTPKNFAMLTQRDQQVLGQIFPSLLKPDFNFGPAVRHAPHTSMH
ncbi:MAG: hypothetical protein GY952_11980 [Rhodobacteraceae bacterium]|nr:hypothetical protein [Paracoccaceae bacterium]